MKQATQSRIIRALLAGRPQWVAIRASVLPSSNGKQGLFWMTDTREGRP